MGLRASRPWCSWAHNILRPTPPPLHVNGILDPPLGIFQFDLKILLGLSFSPAPQSSSSSSTSATRSFYDTRASSWPSTALGTPCWRRTARQSVTDWASRSSTGPSSSPRRVRVHQAGNSGKNNKVKCNFGDHDDLSLTYELETNTYRIKGRYLFNLVNSFCDFDCKKKKKKSEIAN